MDLSILILNIRKIISNFKLIYFDPRITLINYLMIFRFSRQIMKIIKFQFLKILINISMPRRIFSNFDVKKLPNHLVIK
jgi:hypothetical protein